MVPVNCPELVDDLLDALHRSGNEPAQIGEISMSLHEAFARHYDITKPSSELLTAVGNRGFANDLQPLLAPERRDDLKKWIFGRDILDVLALLPQTMTPAEILPLLRKLAPRLYSIASSLKAHPGQAHLAVGSVRYESHGRLRKGVASTFLANRVGDFDYIKVFVHNSPRIQTARDGNTHIIMVGPGTGIAPFRAFLEERLVSGAKGKNWLFFGDQRRAPIFFTRKDSPAGTRTDFIG